MQTVYSQLLETKEAFDSEPRAKATLLELLPELLALAPAMVTVDATVATAVEQVCMLLKSVGECAGFCAALRPARALAHDPLSADAPLPAAPDHVALKTTIEGVKTALKQAALQQH